MNETTNEKPQEEHAEKDTHVPVPTPSPSTAAPSSVPVAPVKTYDDTGWSWGGFMFNLMFAIAIKRYMYLLWGVLFFIPLINVFAILGLMIYFGVQGRELARTSTTFDSPAEYLGFMKGVDHAGKILAIAYAVMIGLVLVLFMLGASAFIRSDDRPYMYDRYDRQPPAFDMMRIEFEDSGARY